MLFKASKVAEQNWNLEKTLRRTARQAQVKILTNSLQNLDRDQRDGEFSIRMRFLRSIGASAVIRREPGLT
jgi:hypothetical protein